MASAEYHIVRKGNRLLVGLDAGTDFPAPLSTAGLSLLCPALSYTELKFLRGREHFLAKKCGLPTTNAINWECFGLDLKGRLGTSFGFLERIEQTFRAARWSGRLTEIDPHPRPEIFEPQWDRLYDGSITFRHRQEELLLKMLANENGQFSCPPGFGKSSVIAFACKALPKAKIAVVTRRVPVLETRLYPELCGLLPNVGIVGCGQRKTGHRVTCYTSASLHHCPTDTDVMFLDEAHEAASDDCASKLARFQRTRMYGLSATLNMRLDNKDMRCEAIFGPLRMVVTYQEGVDNDMIVPIAVNWSNVGMDVDPCVGTADPVEKKRAGIWRNDYRNSLIVADARRYPDKQVLVTCEVIEHVLAIQKQLPEGLPVYHELGVSHDSRIFFEKEGLIGDDFKHLTQEDKQQRISRLVAGEPGIYVANTVLNVGVDCRYLPVLCRADAGGSPINDTQLPGRTSRINERGKDVGIVHDYLDQFNRGFRLKAAGRFASYEENGWDNIVPDSKSRRWLEKRMGWEK